MQVKIFSMANPASQRGKRTDELEAEINDWLGENPTIEIVNVAQSFGSGGAATQELVVSVWFLSADEVARNRLGA